MTIEFPKFPNRRHKNTSSDRNVNKPIVDVSPISDIPPPNHTTTETLSAERKAELKNMLPTAPTEESKKNSLLPILAGVLLLGALGAVAYPFYQTMSEEKTAAITPPVTKSTTTNIDPKVASSTATVVTSASSAATTSVATQATTPVAVTTASMSSPAAISSDTKATKDDNLQKPLLVDNIPSSQPEPKSEIKAATKIETNLDKKIDTKIDTADPTTTAQNKPLTKQAGAKNGMSYDEFVKTSDTAVFIEPPSKAK